VVGIHDRLYAGASIERRPDDGRCARPIGRDGRAAELAVRGLDAPTAASVTQLNPQEGDRAAAYRSPNAYAAKARGAIGTRAAMR
jgi:hypothetical protein